MSSRTKQCLVTLWVFRLLEFLVIVLPIVVYIIIALTSSVSETKKITLIGMIGMALIIGMVNLLFQKRLRSPIWLIFLGLYVAIDKLIPLILIVAIGSILDEFFITPMIDKTKIKVVTNKEMDKRLQ